MSEEVENLAFKDRKELANLNSIDLLNIIEFLQQRIDNAMEHIRNCTSNPLLHEQYLNAGEVIELLEILKGGNDE